MFRLFNTTRKTILFASCFVLVIFAVAFTWSVKTNSQQLQVPNQENKIELLKQIEQSANQSLRIAGNSKSPLRIDEVKVKELSGSKFTELTGKTITLETVSSVPEVTVTNTSQHSINELVLIIRDPKLKYTRGLVKSKLSIPPGGNYVVKRQDFVKPDNLKNTLSSAEPGADAGEFWVSSGERIDLYVAVGKVKFETGDSWIIDDEGEVQ